MSATPRMSCGLPRLCDVLGSPGIQVHGLCAQGPRIPVIVQAGSSRTLRPSGLGVYLSGAQGWVTRAEERPQQLACNGREQLMFRKDMLP